MSVEIHAGAGQHGPDIIELKVHDCHEAATEAAEMLNLVFDGVPLQKLRSIDEVFKTGWITVFSRKIIQYLLVSARAFLVALHHAGTRVHVLFFPYHSQRLAVWHCFNAKF